MSAVVSVLIPASNEALYIGHCLEALMASDPAPALPVEVIVVANGCQDDTAAVARGFEALAGERGWQLSVLDLSEGGKIGALNAGDAAASGTIRIYLDADVLVSPSLLAEVTDALMADAPCFATGTPVVAPAKSWLTTQYARFWKRLPFVNSGAPGFGLFAVNSAGRARWGSFPNIISDDTFVRLNFTPEERVQVPSTYVWPMVEGLGSLVRVRRRQDRGTAEIARLFPELLPNEGKPKANLPRLITADPMGFFVYGLVSLLVRLPALGDGGGWSRGR